MGFGLGGLGGGSTGGGRGCGPGESAAQRQTIEMIRAYWEGLRPEEGLPSRAQIDPRGMAGALSGAFMIERIAPGVGRLRIAGMQLVDLMGMEVRGMPLSALFDPAGRSRLAAGLELMFQRPSILQMTADSVSGIGRPELSARIILLPLASDGARAEVALGCMAFSGSFGRRPRRLSLVTLENLGLGPARLDLRAPFDRAEGALRRPALLSLDSIPPQVARPRADHSETAFETVPTRHQRPYLRLVKTPDA